MLSPAIREGSTMAKRNLRERFESQGTEVVAGSGEQFAASIRKEATLYASIIKAAGIQPE